MFGMKGWLALVMGSVFLSAAACGGADGSEEAAPAQPATVTTGGEGQGRTSGSTPSGGGEPDGDPEPETAGNEGQGAVGPESP